MLPATNRDIAAVVLAAGASTRMGQAKALLMWRGRRFVDCCIELAGAAGVGTTVIVTGASEVPRRSDVENHVYAHNPNWSQGPLSSLQVGLRQAQTGANPRGFLLLTVDRPHLQQATIDRLCQAFCQQPQRIWQPLFDDRRGHPLVLPAACAQALLELPPTGNRRELLNSPRWSQARGQVAVDDPAVLENLDTPQALAAALARLSL